MKFSRSSLHRLSLAGSLFMNTAVLCWSLWQLVRTAAVMDYVAIALRCYDSARETHLILVLYRCRCMVRACTHHVDMHETMASEANQDCLQGYHHSHPIVIRSTEKLVMANKTWSPDTFARKYPHINKGSVLNKLCVSFCSWTADILQKRHTSQDWTRHSNIALCHPLHQLAALDTLHIIKQQVRECKA